MFETDSFIAACVEAAGDRQPRLAVRNVLERAMADPSSVAGALPPVRAGITKLHVAPEITILQVVWAPGMILGPHDHRMWAAIGIYTGGEDNSFYRRHEGTLTASGGTRLRPSDVALLGDEAIHAVANPTKEFTGSIHIYGGDFFATPRSEWRGDPYREQPYDVQSVLDRFEAANAGHAT
jgi:predicted metal-dependent enzyme (double-stranded beta helix superfamily)